MDRSINAHVIIAKELVEEKIKSTPGTPIENNESLKSVIRRLGEAYGAKVWLAGSDGKILLKSFPGPIPPSVQRYVGEHFEDKGNFQIYHKLKRRWELYAIIPTDIQQGRRGALHILYEKSDPEGHERPFALGLAGIGLAIAILVIPVTRFITKRVKELSHSAFEIAEGDLSHRATVKGNDEIGELGRIFNRMADKLEKMIRGGRELTANISHELRTPLARIRIAEELLREKLERTEYEDLQRYLKDIREDIEELDHLIGRILDLSKLDLHERPFKTESIDLSAMINELLDRLTSTIDQKDLHLQKQLLYEHSFEADPEAMRIALSNILGNAVKYSPEDGELIVNTEPVDGGLAITVTNTCNALQEEDLDRIFEPFYRAGKSSEKGSGLGLAITKKIIEKHGGRIEACNVPEGLKIAVHLPTGSPDKRD